MWPWTMFGLMESEWMAQPVATRLLTAASLFMGGRYSGKGEKPQAPFGIHPDFVTLPDGKDTVCSTFTACVLWAMYPDRAWSKEDWKDFQVMSPAHLDSPMFPLERHLVGERVGEFQPENWHLVQGWRSTEPPSGHSFFALPVRGGALIVHSSSVNRMGPTVDYKDDGWITERYPAARFIARLRPS